MSDAYKVGISLLMQSNHAQVLGMLSQQLLGVNAKVNQLTGSFKGLKLAIGGALAIYGGEKMFRVLGGMVEQGGKIVHQQEMLRIAGLRNLDVVEATRRAYEVSGRVQTTTISENLKHLGELRYAMGDMSQASKYIERVSQANAVLNSIKGGGHDEVWSMVKSLEEKGLANKGEDFTRYIDIMTKAVEASRGRVTPSLFFNAFKYGRTSMLGWDETFIGQYLPRAIQMFTGAGGGASGTGGPGNALMSAFQTVVGGTMNQSAVQEWRRLGLVDGMQVVPGGKPKAHIKNSDLFIQNPYEFAQQELAPRMAKMFGGSLPKGLGQEGIQAEIEKQFSGGKSQYGVIQEISRLFQQRTASQIMTQFVLQGRYMMGNDSPWEKDAKQSRGSMGVLEAFNELMKNDPTMAMQAFRAQWESFKQALGYAAVGPAMLGLHSLTDVITKLTKGAFSHPQAVKAVLASFGTLAGLLVGAGGIAILSALGPTGWFILGLTALAGVLTYIYPMLSKILGFDRQGLHRGKGGGSASHYLNNFGRDAQHHRDGLDWDKLVPGKGKPMSWPKTTFGPNGEVIDQSTVGVNQWQNPFKPFIQLRPPVDRLNRNIERLNQGLEKQGSLGGSGGGGGGLNWPGGAAPAMYTGGGVSAAPFAGGGMPTVPFGSGTSKAGVVHKHLASLGAPIGSAGAGGSVSPATGVPSGRFVDRLKRMEGWKSHAYWDYAQYSIGYGTKAKSPNEVIDRAEGERRLQHEVNKALGYVDAINPNLDSGTRYALGDLVYNAGPGALKGIHGAIKSGNTSAIKSWLGSGRHYATAGHRFHPGLYKRRLEESGWVGNPNAFGGSQDSGAIPPPAKKDIHIHHSSILDGRVVARSTMKHIVGMGNGPARAPRLHDPLSTGPITV